MPGSRIAALIGAAVLSAVAMFIVMMISLFFVVSAVDPMSGRPLDGGLLMMGGVVRTILILPIVALIYFFAARWQGWAVAVVDRVRGRRVRAVAGVMGRALDDRRQHP